jgi:hypothetical protein
MINAVSLRPVVKYQSAYATLRGSAPLFSKKFPRYFLETFNSPNRTFPIRFNNLINAVSLRPVVKYQSAYATLRGGVPLCSALEKKYNKDFLGFVN